MEPTRIYVKPILALMQQVTLKGMAHITGGGLVDNLPRVLPQHLAAVLQRDAWPMPPVFSWLQQAGGVADAEMHRVFNCGIGLTLVVDAQDEAAALAFLRKEGLDAWTIGRIVPRTADEAPTRVV